MTVMRKEDEEEQQLCVDGGPTSALRQETCKRKTGGGPVPSSRSAKKPHLGGINMLNGYRSDDGCPDGVPVATLSNMGNTCYLNSVLYTLRFTPAFLHNLHHLATDVATVHSRVGQVKAKTSSLGRNVPGLGSQTGRSSSSKDLPSLGGISDIQPKNKLHLTTEKLHELYTQLRSFEMRENGEPYQPAAFLQALMDVNSLYRGNQQQDAHELLVNLLDILRETCVALASHADDRRFDPPDDEPTTNGTGRSWATRRSKKKGKEPASNKKKADTNGKGNESDEHSSTENERPRRAIGHDFVSENFGGVSLLRTKCLECESVTERKEPFYDICVPLPSSDNDLLVTYASDIYRAYCVTSENLRDANKYWCDYCVRYNEACTQVSSHCICRPSVA